MPEITKLSPQKKNPNRYNVFIDGSFYCGVDGQVVLDFELFRGKQIEPTALADLFKKSEISKIYMRMLDYLSRRPRSKFEMKTYGRKIIRKYDVPSEKEEQEEILESLVQRMEESKYLDELLFAVWWVEQRTLGAKPKSLSVIRQELAAKGVNQQIIQEAWEKVSPDQQELLQRHVEKVLHKYDLEDQSDIRKFISYMLRKGFSYEDVKKYINTS